MVEIPVDWLIDLGVFIIVVLAALIVKALLERKLAHAPGEVLASSGPVSEPASEEDSRETVPEPPPREETEAQRLTRMEKELAERESKVKAERIRELEERQKVIKKREAEQVQQSLEPEPPKNELLEERSRIMELIKKTEERYSNGEMEERSFKMILSGYQQQIIDIDIQLRKKKP